MEISRYLNNENLYILYDIFRQIKNRKNKDFKKFIKKN